MNEEVKISEAEYRLLKEDAKKVLDELSPEQVSELRTKAVSELNTTLDAVNKNREEQTNHLNGFRNAIMNSQMKNPFRNAKRNYWLTQIANFIAVAVFKVPRELTPSVGYPYGAEKTAREFDEHVSKTNARLIATFEESTYFYTKMYEYFSQVKENISQNDLDLIVLYNSCDQKNISSKLSGTEPEYLNLSKLLYNNGVLLEPKIFKTNMIAGNMIALESSLEENLTNHFEKVRGNVSQKSY